MKYLMIVFPIVAFSSILGVALATSFNKKIPALFLGWAFIGGMASYYGFFEDTEAWPPRFVFLILPATLIVAYAVKSIEIDNVNTSWLLGIHVLRIPVELILFQLYLEGVIPRSMTYEGWNWDILSGISALVMMVLYNLDRLPPIVLRIWNWLALGLLLVIIFTAILSAPGPLQQLAFDQPNVAVLMFPFTWLPSVLVPIVLLSHLLLFRKIKAPEYRSIN